MERVDPSRPRRVGPEPDAPVPNLALVVTNRRVHLVCTFVWLSLAVPTVLWWKTSIAWVAWMSLYANVVGHWSAWQASRAEEAAGG